MINTMKVELNEINVLDRLTLTESIHRVDTNETIAQEGSMSRVSKMVVVALVGFVVLAASMGLANSVVLRSAQATGLMPEVVVRAEMPRLMMDEVVVRPARLAEAGGLPKVN
jgi:hypothetical protein